MVRVYIVHPSLVNQSFFQSIPLQRGVEMKMANNRPSASIIKVGNRLLDFDWTCSNGRCTCVVMAQLIGCQLVSFALLQSAVSGFGLRTNALFILFPFYWPSAHRVHTVCWCCFTVFFTSYWLTDWFDGHSQYLLPPITRVSGLICVYDFKMKTLRKT